MKPEIGKWYMIDYNHRKRGYHGKAKCLQISDLISTKRKGLWVFRTPNQPEGMSLFSYMLLSERDIEQETTSESTYEELKELMDKLKSAYQKWNTGGSSIALHAELRTLLGDGNN